jgi:hypothetical protein
MRTKYSCLNLIIIGFWFFAAPLYSQDACPVPPYTLPVKSPNIFAEQQDIDLGDAMAEQIQNKYRVIDDYVTDNVRSGMSGCLDTHNSNVWTPSIHVHDFCSPQVRASAGIGRLEIVCGVQPLSGTNWRGEARKIGQPTRRKLNMPEAINAKDAAGS